MYIIDCFKAILIVLRVGVEFLWCLHLLLSLGNMFTQLSIICFLFISNSSLI